MTTQQVADSRQFFARLAKAAIASGYVTRRECGLISRPGTRKAGIWIRHSRDLQTLVIRRMQAPGRPCTRRGA